ncbi:hypothetical protein [Anaeromassilibacillus senegalensis]|uniref:hypothetical protein n=1 Tax=Anaeromassilibacillus senegalensis TaxID=1673717 RepID=UPI00067FEA4D|nr:hypothetical protein [Anaeromassilibacillus senegalensis]NLN72479.1 hypothetical protein [Thermoplasmatales archaeon]
MVNMVNFLMINGNIQPVDMFGYIENVVTELQKKGLITKIEYSPAQCDFGDDSCLIEVEDTFYVANFIYSKDDKENHWQIAFEYGTYNSCSQLQIKILSADYELNVADNYLEQLKFAIKLLVKPNWEKIIWLMDKDSEQLSIALYPRIYRVENLARQLISEIMTKEYGFEWWDTYVPLTIKNKHMGRLGGYKSITPGFANVDERLMSIDIGDLNSIITLKEKKWNPAFIPEISSFLNEQSDMKLERMKTLLSAQMIVSIDLWVEQFSKYLSEDFIKDFKTFELNRNHIVHNKLIDRSAYGSISNSISTVEAELIKALAKIEQVVVSKEQREAREQQRAIEQEEMEVALKDIMESEAGVKIRNSQEIIEVYEEQLFIFHSELQEYLRFRNDLEIGEYKSIENDTGILFEIRYKVNDESAIVSYSIECMDDSQGSESVVAVNIMVGENVFSKDIAYTNGEISFNSHQSCYMPETQDSISMEDLSALKEGAVDFLNEQFENLREKVDSEMFSIIKDGGSSPLAEFSCWECGEEYICIDENYGALGQCLNCGEMNDICFCDRCESYFEGTADEDGPNFCENCLEDFNKE